MEQKIRQRRLQALRSGATSAQLAAQELQTLLAAQQGAQAVAEDYLKQRAAIEAQYAGYEYANEIKALEDYAQRMMHAENLQAQYDVARMQTDPTLIAMEMAKSMGEDWDQLTLKQKQEYIDVVTGKLAATELSDRAEKTWKGLGYYWKRGGIPGIWATIDWILGDILPGTDVTKNFNKPKKKDDK